MLLKGDVKQWNNLIICKSLFTLVFYEINCFAHTNTFLSFHYIVLTLLFYLILYRKNSNNELREQFYIFDNWFRLCFCSYYFDISKLVFYRSPNTYLQQNDRTCSMSFFLPLLTWYIFQEPNKNNTTNFPSKKPFVLKYCH